MTKDLAQETSGHSGEATAKSAMQAQAPGLLRDLSRLLSKEACNELSRAFEIAAFNGGLVEEPIQRPAGASYNPRPARLCAIAIKELKETNPEFLKGCLLFYLRPQHPDDLALSSEGNPLWLEMARRIAHDGAPFPGADFPDQHRLWMERLVLLHSLDLLRHLHMTSWNKNERLAFRTRLIEEVCQELRLEKDRRLMHMIDHLLSRKAHF